MIFKLDKRFKTLRSDYEHVKHSTCDPQPILLKSKISKIDYRHWKSKRPSLSHAYPLHAEVIVRVNPIGRRC
jgi:hypothetical protein